MHVLYLNLDVYCKAHKYFQYYISDELKSMFEKAGLVEVQNLIDRRLQVNRGKQLKMYRMWIQCKYKKPEQPEGSCC